MICLAVGLKEVFPRGWKNHIFTELFFQTSHGETQLFKAELLDFSWQPGAHWGTSGMFVDVYLHGVLTWWNRTFNHVKEKKWRGECF